MLLRNPKRSGEHERNQRLFFRQQKIRNRW